MNDLIYRTEMAKYKAVIDDVKEKNKKGQPVLIGTISIEKNEVLALMMEREGLRPQVLNAKNHEKEARIISQAGRFGLITIATNMAGRGVDIMLGGEEPAFAEVGGNPEIESSEHKAWKEERAKVLAAGGLYVIGTERHESRRIDNQLRGRSGRQGDPGLSRFYVSMEDDLMRIFGGDRMKNIMTTLKVPEDMPIENKMISKSIESAQKKVEGNNFDMRKHLVDYDDVLNKHRDAIYRKRKDILKSTPESEPRLSEVVLKMIENEVEEVISFHTASEDKREWNIDEIYQTLTTIFPVADPEKKEIFSDFDSGTPKLDLVKIRTEMIEHVFKLASEKYNNIIETAKTLNIEWGDVERAVLVRSIDALWIEHLETISILRQGIGLRGYGQRDPLVEYKKEAYTLYNQLNSLIQKEVVYAIYKVGSMDLAGSREMVKPEFDEKKIKFEAPAKEMGDAGHKTYDVIPEKVKNEDGDKVGRNDLCPCGSGKKYKKCCGK
jgi:preprotein translocase subunit SecA